MMKLNRLIILAILTIALASCHSKQTVLPYFTDLPGETGEMAQQEYSPEIKADDELLITVSSSVPEAVMPYSLPATNPALRREAAISSTPREQTYVVDSKGDIQFPELGVIHCAGLTVEQLQDLIQSKIRRDVKDAIVRVQMMNWSVVVAGEVARPGTVITNKQRFSILDALGAVGDLTPYGERENVLIIREENGKRIYARLNLNKAETLQSPYFYLRQNDYIYVEPNHVRQSNAKYNQDNAFKLSVISTVVSAASVIASLVIALTIK